MNRIVFFATALIILFTSKFYPQKILSFDFSSLVIGNEITDTSKFKATNLLTSTISRGPGVIPIAAPINLDPGLFNSSGWTINNFIDTDDYIEFTIAPKAGWQFSINSIVIKHERNGSGPQNFILRTSSDNFQTNIGGIKTIPQVNSRPIVTEFICTFIDQSTPLTVRLYAYNASNLGTWGLGRGTRGIGTPISDDHLIVNGFVTSENSPSIFLSNSELLDISYFVSHGPSFSKSFSVIGNNLNPLNGFLTLLSGPDYEISIDNFSFNSSLNLSYNNGVLPSNEIFVRLKSNLGVAEYNNQNILIAGGSATTRSINCTGFVSPYRIAINEILPQSNGIDANYDGVNNTPQDQFIELVNLENVSLDLTGYTIFDLQSRRHTFTPVIIQPLEAIVVFSGGSLINFSYSQAQLSSRGGLFLDDTGDKIIIYDNLNRKIAAQSYGFEGTTDQSLARNTDFTGPFVLHSTISTNPVLISPGKRNSDAAPLPVELSSFSAMVLENKVKLGWRTETEVNNYGFEVERSVPSAERPAWEKIGFVNGNGNSNSPKDYTFEDNSVTASKYSYRLKQIDNDGQYSYSKIIEVDLSVPLKFELSQNYPNPFNPATTIGFSLPEAAHVKLTVFNLLGEEVTTLVNENREAGVHTINFDASGFNSGIYVYKIETNSKMLIKKMVLLK